MEDKNRIKEALERISKLIKSSCPESMKSLEKNCLQMTPTATITNEPPKKPEPLPEEPPTTTMPTTTINIPVIDPVHLPKELPPKTPTTTTNVQSKNPNKELDKNQSGGIIGTGKRFWDRIVETAQT